MMPPSAVKWIIRLLALVVCAALIFFGASRLMEVNPTAREVIGGGMFMLTSIFTSPFILEASLAFIGLVIVMTYNQHKLDREGKDEWVLLPKDEPNGTPSATQVDSPAEK